MEDVVRVGVEASAPGLARREDGSLSLRALGLIVWRQRWLAIAIEGGLLFVCLLYCLIAPNQYEAKAKLELRGASVSSLGGEGPDSGALASQLSTPLGLETAAGVLRSDQLAWRVISEEKLYEAPGFRGSFARRFPGFHPQAPSPEAQQWLLERFAWRLHVETMPRTLLIQIRFRSRDAALSTQVVNGLIRAYEEQERETQVESAAEATGWLQGQLAQLKMREDRDEKRLAEFQAAHGIVATPETTANGQPDEEEHDTVALQIDELGRQLAAATANRILCEAEYRAAAEGDPETVITGDPRLQQEDSGFATAVLAQIRARRSDLEQEQAQLSAEHGPNFPRVVEIRSQLQDLERQKQAEDAKLVEHFRSNWQTAADRERMVRAGLEASTAEGLRLNQAATQYAVMRQEDNASHDVYVRVLERVEEAGMAAGARGSSLTVVDAARQPARPVTPDLPLYMAITFFAGLWLAVGGALVRETMSAHSLVTMLAVLALGAAAPGATARGQAPTPNLSGLPVGVVKLPQTEERRVAPDPRAAETPGNGAAETVGLPAPALPVSAVPMPAPIVAGDLLEVTESHTPEFRSSVRVSAAGTVALPMVGEVKLAGLDEMGAAHAIEAALASKGMLLHPLVEVLVTAYAGQDVSVLGEVSRPGVYPYTYHHRLLDLISAAAGLSPNAGRLVNVFHAGDAKTPHPVVLDPGGTDTGADHNPELSPGDTVQVSRAGLVYVVGDVIRPGGFPVDPVQGLTVVQALSLAWGPTQNAATNKAVLIREQKGGRTLTTLNLKRMLRGQDPDQLVQDRDILYIPDSVGKNLWNRTMESAIQSAFGVTIYSALVYSQRY